jgi:hypothetical protein
VHFSHGLENLPPSIRKDSPIIPHQNREKEERKAAERKEAQSWVLVW